MEIEKAGRIGTYTIKSGMPKRDLSGKSSKEIPALAQTDPDEDHDHHMENVRVSLEERHQGKYE
jgi:hypothetical protein